MRLISAGSGVQVPAPPPLSQFTIVMPLLERVRLTIRKHALAPAGTRVLVAISGGPDSVALTHLLIELQSAGDLVVAGLAHFNHQLRGDDADADESFCRTLAATLRLPIEVGRADVAAAA